VARAGTIVAGSIQVAPVSDTQTYDYQIRVNGTTVATISLPASTLGASSTALSVAIVANDVITTFLTRTSGSVTSAFTNEHGTVQVNS